MEGAAIGALVRFDPLVFSSVWAGLVAAALTLAATASFGSVAPAIAAALAGFAFCGTLVVYNVDRLRDLERDRTTSPSRARFVERYAAALRALVATAGLGCLVLARELPLTALAACAAVVTVGLLHRRLKRLAALKTAYVTVAWLVVTVAVPALAVAAPTAAVLEVAAIFGLAIAANLIASNLRDREALTARVPVALSLGVAIAAGALAAAIAALGPRPRAALAAVPIAQGLAIAGLATLGPDADRERYGLAVVDGALWLGALVSLLAG